MISLYSWLQLECQCPGGNNLGIRPVQGSLGVWYPHSGSEPNQHLNLKPIYEALGPSRLVGLSVIYFNVCAVGGVDKRFNLRSMSSFI